MFRFLWVLACFFCSCAQRPLHPGEGTAASKKALLEEGLHTVSETFADITRSEDERVPPEIIKQAECIVVIPDIYKAAFMAGASHGSGVASCRLEDTWSDPAFVLLTGGSFGLQLGAEQSDLLLLMMDKKSKQSLLENQLTLGVNAGIAAGPDGERITEKTNTELSSIYAYSKSKGAFAGLSFDGAVLRPDEENNQTFYGSKITTKKILLFRSERIPSRAVKKFQELLNRTAK